VATEKFLLTLPTGLDLCQIRFAARRIVAKRGEGSVFFEPEACGSLACVSGFGCLGFSASTSGATLMVSKSSDVDDPDSRLGRKGTDEKSSSVCASAVTPKNTLIHKRFKRVTHTNENL
jgi:hypothetical protein